jgi:hypothetical protein
MSPIAQDQLHQSPSISASPHTGVTGPVFQEDPANNRIFSLLRTLIGKPTLAKLVRRLEVNPQDYTVPLDCSILPNQSAESLKMLYLARPRVSQYALIAMILDRTENLEVLDLERLADRQIWRHKYDALRYCCNKYLVQQLFCDHAATEPMFARDLSAIPGLSKLKELNLNGAPLEFSWCMLPQLTTIRLATLPLRISTSPHP